jgi:pyruvate/2-oxoglutarate dehydrogenase complex dihydrolipoamide acyltransferase (E2) component
MPDNDANFKIIPFPKIRRPMVDGGRMGRQKHTIHGLVEMDVTHARRVLRDYKARTGESFSFTAFFMACLGKAVEMNTHMHACRNLWDQLVLFDDVDVNTIFEVEVEGRKLIRNHIIRAVNRKTPQEIHQEIRAYQVDHEAGREAGFFRWFVLLPGFVRRAFYWFFMTNPHRRKEYLGTVSLTAVGMYGTGGGWGIPVTNHTLQLTLGGISEKPGVVDGKIEIREYLCVTVSIDHDIVDGAPAARFTQHLKELVESCCGLSDL